MKLIKSMLIVSFILFSVVILIPNKAQALNADSETIYRGIDVSGWQGTVDFNAVASSGIQIVYIKSSEGQSFVDAYFRSHYEGAKAART
jgi:GH25 family lysozyme M1 (1,4-beta-N-acetylmuramidase)